MCRNEVHCGCGFLRHVGLVGSTILRVLVCVAVSVAIAYLVGSIPVAVIVASRRGIDPRHQGDNNPGWWNTKELLGKRLARLVLVGDLAKGSISVGIAWLICASKIDLFWPIGLGVTAAAMVGHAWPVFAGFRGGRSILTFVGGFVTTIPIAGALALVTVVVVRTITGKFSVASVVGCLSAILWAGIIVDWRAAAATALTQSIIGIRFAQASMTRRRAHATSVADASEL